MSTPIDEGSTLMRRWSEGDSEALDQLIELVYGELRQLAHSRLRSERADHTLRTTALIHEAYMQMKQRRLVFGDSRSDFFAVASIAMRRVLIDYARSRLAVKRGAGNVTVALEDASEIPESNALLPEDLIALDDALIRLEEYDAELNRIVEMRFFGGLKLAEIASFLGVSKATVKRRWAEARLWLAHEIQRELDEPPDTAPAACGTTSNDGS